MRCLFLFPILNYTFNGTGASFQTQQHRAASWGRDSRVRKFSQTHLRDVRAGYLENNAKKSTQLAWDDVSSDARSRFYVLSKRSNKMTQFLVGITVATFVLQIVIPELTGLGLKLSDKIRKGNELYRLITPIFLHGSYQHISSNMISLLRLGGDVENLFGSARYFMTYMVAGIAGNVCSVFASPTPSLGASGSVFGIIGAYAVFLTRNRWILGAYGRRVNNSVLQTLFLQLVVGFFETGIDQWAHLGGAIGGAAMAYFVGPRLYLTETPKNQRAVIDRPFLRAPQVAETIPSYISLKCRQMTSGLLRRPAPSKSESLRTLVEDDKEPPPIEIPQEEQRSLKQLRFWNRM